MMINLLHDRLANSVLFYFVIMLVWSLWRLFRKQGVDGSYRGALIISGLLVLAQGALGSALWLTDLRPDRGSIHLIYGVISVLGPPFLFSLFRGREHRYELIAYSLLYLFLIGIVLRAIMTG